MLTNIQGLIKGLASVGFLGCFLAVPLKKIPSFPMTS